MTKFLLISGSPREGNTDYILKKIFSGIKSKDKELIILRNKKIEHCCGCLSCDDNKMKCVIKDDMKDIFKELRWADVLIIGTPNYYDNVSGLLKDFIDRTNPYFETEFFKGKKLIDIVVGGGKVTNSKKVSMQAIKSFADSHKLTMISSYQFSGIDLNAIENDKIALTKIDTIIKKVNAL